MSIMKERAYEYLVDSKGEGGLVCDLDRSPMVDQPTLIIGLGGTGIDAMLNAKYVIQRKMLAPEGKKKPGRLAFVAVDTDKNAFAEKRVGDVRVDKSEEVCIEEPKLAGYMNNPDLIPQEYLRDWLCKGINATAITYGAGGIRQCGRFMLINQAQKFIDHISKIVGEIWGAGDEKGAAFKPETPVNVYILTGVSGGTGSGTYLDVAYLVREIIVNQMHRKARMRGFIFMPDVNLCKVQDPGAREYIPVNGYAALRELDFWMNAERGRSFRQQYTATVTINTVEKPFDDLCCLVSPNGSLPEDYSNCMKTTGEALMNILTAPAEGEGSGLSFEGYVTNLNAMLTAASIKNTYSGNYVYAAMGMDEQRLQLDSLANYLAYHLLLRVNSLFEREPLKDEVEAVFKKELKLDHRIGLLRLFDKTIPAAPFNEPVRSLDDFKNAIKDHHHADVLNGDVLDDELKMWVSHCESVYNKSQNDILEECSTALKLLVEKYFRDMGYGPYYAHRMLHNTEVGKPDILKRLEEEKNAVAAFINTASDREDQLKKTMNAAKDSAERNRWIPIVNKTKYDEYTEAAYQYYNHIRYTKFALIAYNFYNRMITAAADYNNRVVERFSELLRCLTEVFKANSDIVTNVERDGNTHTWNVGNFNKIRASVEKALEDLKNSGKEDILVSEFLSWMLDEREAWVGDEGGLGGSFSRFVSLKFRELMDQSMEETYKDMHNLTSDEQLRQHMLGTVLPKLQSGAKVLYTPDGMLSPIENAPCRSMIQVPSAATVISAAADDYAKHSHLNCDVVPSKRQGSLFWFQANLGMPMYAHNALRSYQTSHDVYGKVDNHCGRYLKMGAGNNWRELLPPLMPEATWEYAGYKNDQRAKMNAATRDMFLKGWDCGLVLPIAKDNAEYAPGMLESKQSQVYVLGVTDKAAFDALMSECPLSAEQLDQLVHGGKVSATQQLTKAVEAYAARLAAFNKDGWEPDPRAKFKNDVFTKLRGGQIIDQHMDDEARTRLILCENILWTPDLVMKMNAQFKLKQRLLATQEACRKYLESAGSEDKEIENFANALIYGLYRPSAPKVFQLDGADVNVPTRMLMTITDYKLAPVSDPFYALFVKYTSFTEEEKEVMERIVKVRESMMNNEMNTGNTARYDRYVNMVRMVDNSMKNRLQAIDNDVTFNKPEIRKFYSEMRKHFALFLPENGMGGMM